MSSNKSVTETVMEQLATLRENYLARLPKELAELEVLVTSLTGEVSDHAILEDLHNRLHKLAGSGGSFGLIALSVATRDLEQRIRSWLEEPFTHLDTSSRQLFAAKIDELRNVITNVQIPETVTSPGHVVQSSEKNILIWLVDDDIRLGNELTQQIESFNYQVHHFTCINDAEVAMQTEQPDLLIMGIMFPQEIEIGTGTPAHNPTLQQLNCPLLFISAQDDFQSRVRAAQIGAAGYLLKPLNVPHLINQIEQIFSKQKAQPQRILIIDDDVELTEHYRLVLLGAGMKVEVLHQPTSIIETVSAFRPELIFMDLRMPDYNGVVLAAVIRQYHRWASLPIVYLSAETDLHLQSRAMECGADDFLTKPVSDSQLIAAARARVNRSRDLAEHITKDSLTGLLKHASIKDAIAVEVARSQRNGNPITVAMLDIDHFKSVNDTYGHATGDIVISAIAMLLRQRMRKSDILGRYGGEEFAAVLLDCDIEDAHQLLDEIRKRFATLRFRHEGKEFSCTLSAGFVSSKQYPNSEGADLLTAADEALYEAKANGRNQVLRSTIGSLSC